MSAKRYRYIGCERDDETGLYLVGARYYAAWLGRWTAADPAGTVDGANLYGYVRGSPVGLRDPSGTQAEGLQLDPAVPPVGWKPPPLSLNVPKLELRIFRLLGGAYKVARRGPQLILNAIRRSTLLDSLRSIFTGPGTSTGCNDCLGTDPSADFLDQAIENTKGLALDNSALKELKNARISIDRTSEKRDNVRFAEYHARLGQLDVSGALADTLSQKSGKWGKGAQRTGHFAEALGVLYHEAHHRKFASEPKPAWYNDALSTFSKASDDGLNERASAELVDEAIGEFIEKSVALYAETHSRLFEAIKSGDSEKISQLRAEYNKTSVSLEHSSLGYWRIYEGAVQKGTGENTSVLITSEMVAHGKATTGLSGNFDTDFAPQLKKWTPSK